jgi:hypothetical protein
MFAFVIEARRGLSEIEFEFSLKDVYIRTLNNFTSAWNRFLLNLTPPLDSSRKASMTVLGNFSERFKLPHFNLTSTTNQHFVHLEGMAKGKSLNPAESFRG